MLRFQIFKNVKLRTGYIQHLAEVCFRGTLLALICGEANSQASYENIQNLEKTTDFVAEHR